MCACRLQEIPRDGMKPTYDLDDYIYEMENRSYEESPDPEDVYAQLAQKEKDLILAAELGKALLEKNEDLSRQNERIAEEYSQKLELLEQDKHSLKRKLEAIESEYESKVVELQSDIRDLRGSLAEREQALVQSERKKAQIIVELTEQNQRLTNQLKESSKTEEQLSSQLTMLRDQFNLRKNNMDDHVTHLEMLREEITFVTEKKNELERRIQQLLEEREGLSSTLDESADRIVMLEKQSREQEVQMRHSQREVEELRVVNVSLTDRLEMMSRSHSASPSTGHRSLMNEMEVSDDGSGSLLEDDVECDDPDMDVPFPDAEEIHSLKMEVLSAYQQVRLLCEQLRQRRRDSLLSTASSDDININKIKVGLLSSVVQELSGLVHDILRREAQGCCPTCGSLPSDRMELEKEVHNTQETLEQTMRQLDHQRDELKKRDEALMELTSKLTIREAELRAVEEERDTLRSDLNNSHLAKDEIVKKAWEVRDKAVQRKNAAEIELARTRIDVLQVNSQLMEAIQQKVELSQQLEQWQVDMQVLLDEQMRKKLTTHEQREREQSHDSDSSSSTEKKKNSRLFGLFQR